MLKTHVAKIHPSEFVSMMLSLKMKVIALVWGKQIVSASSMLQSPKATDLTPERTQEKDNISTFKPNERVSQQKDCDLPNEKV